MKVSTGLKQLLTSQTRTKLISIFFYQPSEIFYVRQLVRLTGEEINSVRRELENLKKIFLISSETRGNRLFYWANPEHHFYYHLLVMAHLSQGLGRLLVENKSKLGLIKAVLYSQEFLHNTTSGNVDILFIGDISLKNLEVLVKEAEAEIKTEINYMVMDKQELKLRRSRRDPIITEFFLNSPATIIGDPINLLK